MTYRIAFIITSLDAETIVDIEGIPLSQMKSTIKRLVETHSIPQTATINVEQENPRKLYFRNLLSTVSLS